MGAHSRSHPKLQELPRQESEAEIIESCRIIRDMTGQESVRDDAPFVVQRVFGERVGGEKSMDGILRSAWARTV